MLAAGGGTDPGRKLGVKFPAHLQIHVLDHFWMRVQLSQVGEGDLVHEDMGMEVPVRDPLLPGQGKVAFPFTLMPG